MGVDVTVQDVLHYFVAQALGNLVSVARLHSAHLAVAAIRPVVAVALARLGVELDGVGTAPHLQEGLSYLDPQARA
jgi:anti-anti-sigma regulatory factor